MTKAIFAAIDSLLAQEDIEGFIEAGAPTDEYRDEAAQIVAAIDAMTPDTVSEEIILASVSYIWMTSFELSQEDLELRLQALQHVSREILKLYHA